MRKLFSIFALVLLYVGITFGQAAIDIPITISDDVGNSRVLYFGLDPTATDGIDPDLGESDLPPFPPPGVYDMRFWLPPFNASALTSYRDYRNAPAFPYSGGKDVRVRWQWGDLATAITFTYNLPEGVQITITSNNATPLWTSGPRTGSGSYTLLDPDNDYSAARLNVVYTNVEPLVPAPIFGIAPPSLSFGTVNLGDNATLPVTVSNTGDEALNITNIVSSDAQFTFAPNTFPVVIPAGGNQVFNVTFAPTVIGLVSGSLTFTHNAAGSPSVLPVQGTGYAPSPVFSVNPASLNFGSVAVGGNSTLPVTVTNTGDLLLTISNIVSSDAQYTFAPGTFPVNIPAGGNAVFNVTFTPAAAGTVNGSLTFTHNAPGSPTIYSLTGIGFTVAPVFGISPTSLNFGNVSVGGTASLPVTISNTGNAPLSVTNIVSSVAQFTFAPSVFPINIAAGGNAVINVTFTPAAAGLVNGSLTITHNAVGSPATVTLEGTGQTQGGLLRFLEPSQSLPDGSQNNPDAVVLHGYTGQPLKALQFDLVVGRIEGKLILRSVERGAAIPAGAFNFSYQIYPGPTLPDGSSIDVVKVVILGNGTNAIMPNPNAQEILKFAFDIVDITTPSAVTYNSLQNVLGATETPVINANISTGPDEIINIYNGTPMGLLGDVNLDNQVNILDILLMIDHILGRVTLTGQAFTQGDIAPWTVGDPLPNPDGVINVLDLSVLQNIVLTGSYPSGDPVNKAFSNPFEITTNSLNKITPGMDAKLTFYLTEKGITVQLESIKKVKGVQIELDGLSTIIPSGTPMTSIFDQALYHQASDFLRTLTYDAQALPVDAGDYLLARIPFQLKNADRISISKIIVADENNNAMQKVEVEIRYDEYSTLPLDYMLSQNYPNPFNPTTTVEFQVPQTADVTLKIFNTLGQEVRTLFSGQLDGGRYKAEWDGMNDAGVKMSSGTYIYRMISGEFVQSKKMTLVK